MAEVLSQQEIDLLLNKMKDGTAEEPVPVENKEVIPFDFRLPNRISKNQLRTLKNIHENFSESFASYLVSKLQAIVNINVTSVDQIYYSEYILSVSNPACLFTFGINNTDIKGILELSPDFAFALVDRLLGGSGTSTKSAKIITPIEQQVLNVVVERIMLDLKKGWQAIDTFDFAVERFEPDIDFAQITSQSESVLLITFEISFGDQSFMMNLCFALFAFDSILTKMSSQKLSAIRPGRYQGTTAQEIISSQLYKTILPVSVEFGKTTVSIKELLELDKGDVLKLQTKISDEHKIKIGDKEMFLGRAGTLNNKKAIKVTQRIEQKENLL